jgi:hypothetical protein
MPRHNKLFTSLLMAVVALMCVGAGDGRGIAGTPTPDVAGNWEGTWNHRQGSGRITLLLAQDGTTVTGRQSVVGLVPLFGGLRGRQLNFGQEVRDGRIEDSTLIFHVQALELPRRQINFTLTISGETMTGTVCGDTCGIIRLQRSRS